MQLEVIPEDRSLSRRSFVLLVVIAVAIGVASLVPIFSYDFFWHVATGRWISDHGALPRTDPFATASDRIDWINGEWLFQVVAWWTMAAVGAAGISVARAFAAALTFGLVMYGAARRGADPLLASFLGVLAWFGADHRFGFRPEAAAIFLVVCALLLILEKKTSRIRVVLYVLLTIAWINVHPSALLAPVIAGAAAAGALLDRSSETKRGLVTQRLIMTVLSAVALLANAHGLRGVIAPLELANFVRTGGFVNTEWLPTRLADFPLFFVVLAAIALLVLVRREEIRSSTSELLLAAMFAVLALRFVRNQGFFYAALPILIAPFLPQISLRLRRVFLLGAVAILTLVVFFRGIGVGWDYGYFPVHAVAKLKASKLEGNFYNPDQLGGYLIWSFYPQRRTLTDGRNELYRTYLAEYETARLDQREWLRLLDKYKVRIAVDEYRRESMESVNFATGEKRRLPASMVYFPRNEWALIAFDDVGMVFAQRSAFDAGTLAKLEYRILVPDGADPFLRIPGMNGMMVAAEIERASKECNGCRVVRRIEEVLRRGAAGQGVN